LALKSQNGLSGLSRVEDAGRAEALRPWGRAGSKSAVRAWRSGR
jgi:hypothetical protein